MVCKNYQPLSIIVRPTNHSYCAINNDGNTTNAHTILQKCCGGTAIVFEAPEIKGGDCYIYSNVTLKDVSAGVARNCISHQLDWNPLGGKTTDVFCADPYLPVTEKKGYGGAKDKTSRAARLRGSKALLVILGGMAMGEVFRVMA